MGAQHEKIPFLLLEMLFQNSKRFGFTMSATTENNWLLVTVEIAGLAHPIFIYSYYMISEV